MALIDVKQYYYKMLNQYLEVKNDLADFEVALQDGHITEDQLASVKFDVDFIKNNLDRLSYVLYLFELPKRTNKKQSYRKANKKLENYFIENKADSQSVADENISVLNHLREELKKLSKVDK